MFGFKKFINKKVEMKKEVLEVNLVDLDKVIENLRSQENVIRVGADLRTPRTARVVVTYKVVTG